jgi:hypothetical protein
VTVESKSRDVSRFCRYFPMVERWSIGDLRAAVVAMPVDYSNLEVPQLIGLTPACVGCRHHHWYRPR